jgi:hypothetical protein
VDQKPPKIIDAEFVEVRKAAGEWRSPEMPYDISQPFQWLNERPLPLWKKCLIAGALALVTASATIRTTPAEAPQSTAQAGE